jgi:hypothetical protein
MEAGGAKADISNETAALTPRNLKQEVHASHIKGTQSKHTKWSGTYSPLWSKHRMEISWGPCSCTVRHRQSEAVDSNISKHQ